MSNNNMFSGHRFQGQTVLQPKKIFVDLTSVFQAAQAYVMLSRVQTLEQLYIFNEVPAKKLYADAKALQEVQRLESISINRHPSAWNTLGDSFIKIAFLNIQSIEIKSTGFKVTTIYYNQL